MNDRRPAPGRRPRVVVYQSVDAAGTSHRQLTDAGCEVVVLDSGTPFSALGESVKSAHALLGATARPERIDADLLRACPDLRIVSKYTIGVDDVDVDVATELGILVTHCPTEANWGGVAEGAIALMLALLKRIEARSRAVKSGGWRSESLRGIYLGARDDGYPGITVGIIGLGRIGRRVARLLAPWNVRIIAADPYVEAGVFDELGVGRCDLELLLAESDVVTIHCALTAETERLLDRKRIAAMRPHAILLNTARGRIVDVEAVCDAIEAGAIAGAAFDVLPEEPPPPDARILKTDERVILSPHMVAANEGGTLEAAIPWATDAVLMALAGELPPRVYNEGAIERWMERFAGRSLLPVRVPEDS